MTKREIDVKAGIMLGELIMFKKRIEYGVLRARRIVHLRKTTYVLKLLSIALGLMVRILMSIHIKQRKLAAKRRIFSSIRIKNVIARR